MKNNTKKPTVYQENGKYYIFNKSKLKEVFDKVKKENGQIKPELIFHISSETGIPEETIANHLRNDETASSPQSPDTVKKYGKLLTGNEYEFLIPIPTEETAPQDARDAAVKRIFRMLYDILACYEASDCFNRVPGTDDTDGARSYFENEIDTVKKELESEFLGKRDSEDYRKLGWIINETEIFIKSYSVPGTVKRWRKINPQINYFDCSFEIIKECGIETARQLYRDGMLDYLPSDYIIIARDIYFAQWEDANINNNLQYSEEHHFQEELLRTLAMVFENDFNDDREDSRVT